MKVAAIDCGTNSIRLLVASCDAQGAFVEHDRQLRLTRLGQGVDATRRFHPEALARTLTAVAEYAQIIAAHDCQKIRFIATSAARDAANSAEFFDGVYSRLGVPAQIIAGSQEAELSFQGALAGVPEANGNILVLDIGGGSTELVNGATAAGITHAVSLDMGSVRIRERFFQEDPPSAAAICQAQDFVDGLLDNSGVDFSSPTTVIGVAGTVTTLAGAALGLVEYDREQVHQYRLSTAAVSALAAELLAMSVSQVMEKYKSIQPKRAEVICGGALILSRIMNRVAVPELIVSESDILDGVARELLAL
ncbi:MAG: exopolyphosphatase [Propionibacteriaceae bacterium]